jgi:hypothetical protein
VTPPTQSSSLTETSSTSYAAQFTSRATIAVLLILACHLCL